SILLGHASPPSALELLAAFPPETFDSMGIHSSQRPYEERVTELSCRVDETIRRAGGWPHICQSVRLWRHEHPDTWNMVAEHIRNVRPRSGYAEWRALRQIALKYRVSGKTVTRRRRQLASLLADSVLKTPLVSADWAQVGRS
ncbi:MAG: hypothetical protein LBF92_03725, partial [Synergistaceae bacterium]|nr:hypothetical protein [Synergistaceae bacterium]